MVGLSFQCLPHASATDAQRAATGMEWCKISDPGLIPVARTYCRNVYLRSYLPDDGDCRDGAAWAQQITASVSHVWPAAIVMRNEISADPGQVAQYQLWRSTLRANGYRGLCVYGSFAVGTPDFGQWPAIVKAFGDSPPDALDLHEYWSLTVAGCSPWWALRHVELLRRGLIPSTWPLFVGETGSDDVSNEDAQRRRGWQDRGKLTPDAMITQLRAFAAGCAPSVMACFVFGDGGSDPNWTSYRTWGTPVESYIRSSNPTSGTVIQTIENPASGPETAAVVERIGHVNPSPLFKFDQGAGTLDCWVECIRSFFLRYGYPLDLDTVFQAGKGHARPAGGEAATFAEVKRAISTLATQLGVTVQSMDCDNPTTVFQALRDPNTANPWTVIAGVAEQDLQPGQQYGHFMILSGFTGGTEIAVVDPLDHYDGNSSGVYPAATLAQGMIDSWEPSIDAEAVKITGKAA